MKSFTEDLFITVFFFFLPIYHVAFSPTPKIVRHAKVYKRLSAETKHSSEPDSHMAEILELSDQEFKITD